MPEQPAHERAHNFEEVNLGYNAELAQQEDLPVMVLLFKEPYEDYGSLEQAPLAPRQTREFRLTIEHLSTDWDRQLPQVKMVGVNY